MHIFEYQPLVVNTVEKWLGYSLDTKTGIRINVFNFCSPAKHYLLINYIQTGSCFKLLCLHIIVRQ